MLCALSGRERTEKEYLTLLQNSGWNFIQSHYPQSISIGIIEAIKS